MPETGKLYGRVEQGFRVAGVDNAPGLCRKVGCVYHKPAALKPGIPFSLTSGTVFQSSRASGALPPSFRGIVRPRIFNPIQPRQWSGSG